MVRRVGAGLTCGAAPGTGVGLQLPAAAPALREGLQAVLQRTAVMSKVRAEAGGGGRRLTRYTVMGWSCLKVRLRAGLELYLHLDSTKRSSASLAWSSDTVGTLGGHARPRFPSLTPLS